MKVEKFEDLDVWRISIEIVKEIYQLTQNNKFNHDFSLREQIRKSAISISSNIAEGFERNTNLELKRFLLIAKGSTGELRTQLYIAKEIGYISNENYQLINNKLIKLSSMIGSFINYLRKKTK